MRVIFVGGRDEWANGGYPPGKLIISVTDRSELKKNEVYL